MSNFIVPNTFVPGTKAKAQEINENFIAIQDELNKKSEKEVDPTQPLIVGDGTESTHAVTKGQLEDYIYNANIFAESLVNFFLIISGNTDSDGEPDIISSDGGVVSFKVDDGAVYKPIVAVPGNLQERYTVASLNSIDLSSYADGIYNIFFKSDGTAYVLQNTILTQKKEPETPSLNTIFVDISKMPGVIKKYNGVSWELFNDIYLGNVTLASGEITEIEHCKFNDNGFNVNRANNPTIIDSYMSAYSGYLVYSNGFCEQWGFLVNVSDNQTITLLTEYRDGGYNIQLTSANASGVNIHSVKVMTGTGNKTTNSFKIVKRDSGNECFYWRTAGYLYY